MFVQVVRGKKAVFEYLTRTATYSTEAFNKFHFNKKDKRSQERPSMVRALALALALALG